MMVLAFVCLDEPAPCAGERGANCSHREAGLLGNLRITHPCIPQQQDLLVPLGERPQGDLHLFGLLIILDLFLGVPCP